MENEKLQVVLNEGQTELVIREGKGKNILDAALKNLRKAISV